jgi:uncharacterized membrane protein
MLFKSVQLWSIIIDAVDGVVAGVLVGVFSGVAVGMLVCMVAVGVACPISSRLSFLQAATETMLIITIARVMIHKMFFIGYTFSVAIPSVRYGRSGVTSIIRLRKTDVLADYFLPKRKYRIKPIIGSRRIKTIHRIFFSIA